MVPITEVSATDPSVCVCVCVTQVKELGRADEVLDLSDYEQCEEMRKNKSRSKKNHSKFRLQRSSCPGNTVRF